jgi:cadherin-like protein/surface protein with Ig-like domain/K319-like protein/FG-GAP repeat protein/PKD domain-containing protein/VCBS repeat protein
MFASRKSRLLSLLFGMILTVTMVVVANEIPQLTNNVYLSVDQGYSGVIDTSHLQTIDTDTPASDLIYTVTQAPAHGHLELDGVLTTQFTQQDIDDGKVVYVNDGATPSPFPAVIELSQINGRNGFTLNGVAYDDFSGVSVSAAGDVNGDGIGDVIIGAYGADPNSNERAGAGYVVFGRSAWDFADTPIELSVLDGTDGFVINGVAEYDYTGISVSAAGDVNGDGYDDVIIGAYQANPNGSGSGASYVVYGRASFGASIELSALDGTDGFVINGVSASDQCGIFVSAAGDVNGDGYDDVIIGASLADPNGNPQAGASYVVFGGTALGSSIELSALNGTDGFVMNGVAENDKSGRPVSSAGDVNGDGFDDVIIGASQADPNGISGAGTSYVMYGRTSFGPTIELSVLNGADGFIINGAAVNDRSGISVSAAGDVNGDGFGDIVIGAHGVDPNDNTSAGASYVVYGGTSLGATIELSALDGNDGLVINGVAASDLSGYSVSAAGDLNGDGYSDVIIGAQGADPNGITEAGASYVVFGGAALGASIELSALDGSDGFVMNGVTQDDLSSVSVSGAGDLNSDGYGDVIIGAYHADPNANRSGASYVVFGSPVAADSADFFEFELTDGTTTLTDRFNIEIISNNTPPVGLPTITGTATQGQTLTADVSGISDADGLNIFSYQWWRDSGAVPGAAGTSYTLTDADVGAQISVVVSYTDGGGTNERLTSDAVGPVSNIYDAPQLTTNIYLSVDQGGRGTIDTSYLQAIDADTPASDLIYTVTQAPAHGHLELDGISTVQFTQQDIDDGKLEYIHDGTTPTPSSFPAVIELSDINGSNGFVLNGAAIEDYSGYSVSSAGDVNGDGIDDVIIGAPIADPHGISYAGAGYVVFGRSAWDFTDSPIELSDLDGTDGFVINGAVEYDYTGESVSSAGDVNGDGYGDIIIGVRLADGAAGASYVVYGRASFGISVELSAIDGTDGFVINGVAAGDQSGNPVSAAGDVNGDGYADILIGAPYADPDGNTSAGASYVVYGGSSLGASIELSGLDGNNGFVMNGVLAGDKSGWSVSSAGDVNADGYDDVIVGAVSAEPHGYYLAGASYVVFGGAALGSSIELSALNDNDGFVMNGTAEHTHSGWTVSSAGDVNGDGYDDVIIGSSGTSHVVYGASTFAASIELSTIHGSDGFVAGGISGHFYVSSAGDLNGDGYSDVLIGNVNRSPNGNLNAGASHVVFGGDTLGSFIDLSVLNGTDGFIVNGIAAGDYSGWSVSGAGDANGDGYPDIIIGAFHADPNGESSGASYVVFNPADADDFFEFELTDGITIITDRFNIEVISRTDTTKPVITLIGASPVTIEIGSAYADAGATASDNADGDITASIVTGGLPIDTSVLGSYTVAYDVTDSSGNAADQITRTVNVVDTTVPVISLIGTSPVTVEINSAYADAGATASDNADGDITASIITAGLPIDTSVLGSYTVAYDVTDSSGNAAAQVTRTVNVVDTTVPVISLTGSSPVTVEIGSAYADAGATASDNADGDITASIVTGGLPIDTSVLGSYTVTYDVTDSSGNAAAQITRTVNIIDTTAPIEVANTGSTVAEGGTDTINSDELAFSDIGQPPGAITYTVTSGPANGQLELTANPGVAITGFTQADIDAGLLVYIHNGSDTTNGNFGFNVDDGRGNSVIGQNFNITVTPVDDTAPSEVSNTGSDVLEGGTDTISSAELAFSDTEQPASSINFTVTSGPANGQMELTTNSGVAITGFTQADIDAGRVVYIHDGSETTNGDFGFNVDDGQGNSVTGQNFAITVTLVNMAPVANAGPDQAVTVGSLVTLDGSTSSDADGDLLSYSWSLTTAPTGSSAVLDDPTSVFPTFTVDVPGLYEASLVVSDGTVDSEVDTVSISTVNVAPVADAGADQAVYVGDTVMLDGSTSFDVDGDSLSYSWSLTAVPTGSSAALDDPTSVTPTFSVDIPGTYEASLVVNDGLLDSVADTVTISTINVAPVADAGVSQSGVVGNVITLDGSQSTDADGDTLTYSWSFSSLPVGSTASLSYTTAAYPTFTADIAGIYSLNLVVNDGTVNSAPDAVSISIVTVETEAITELQETITEINNIDPDLFKNSNQVKPLTNKINTVIASIEDGNIQGAIDKLETDILKKTNGCATDGSPDNNDWIQDCPSQAIVYERIMDILDLLKTL